MKQIINNIGNKMAFLFLCMMSGAYAFAQDTATTASDTATAAGLPSADYHVQMPKHLDPFYNGPLRYIIMGVVIAFLAYLSYRYWEANKTGKDFLHDQ